MGKLEDQQTMGQAKREEKLARLGARTVTVTADAKCPTCGRPFKQPWKDKGVSRATYFRRKALPK